MLRNSKGSTLLLYLVVLQVVIVFGGFCFDGVRLMYSDVVLNGSVRHAAVSASSALLQSEEIAQDIAVEVLQRNCEDALLTETTVDEESVTVSAQLQVKLYFMHRLTTWKDNTIKASYTAYNKT